MRLATRNEMRELEAEVIRDGGYPSAALMETAGREAARIIRDAISGLHAARIVCGRGNNGGDGFVIARYLAEHGWTVRLQFIGTAGDVKGDPAVYAGLWRWIGGAVEESPEGDIGGAAGSDELQIDAMLGTGLDRPVSGAYAAAIAALNQAAGLGAPVCAVDIPSGLDADKGSPLGDAVRAHLTVTMGLGKPGLFCTPGTGYAGEVRVLDIGFPERSLQRAATGRLLTPDESIVQVPARELESHKGSYGHVLVLGGSPGKAGAALLACRGALRAGAGLVTLSAPEGVRAAQPEIMHEPVEAFRPSAWRDALTKKKDALVFGPGVGVSDEAAGFLACVAGAHVPLVLDADGLNLLARQQAMPAERTAATVLTPHPAEAARLLDSHVGAIQSDRIGSAIELAKRYQATVVLKGARSVIAQSDGRFWINTTGSPAMATGGTGDVLSGVVAAMLAAGYAADKAACLATYVHGRAGEGTHPAGGLLAGELADRIPQAMAERIAP